MRGMGAKSLPPLTSPCSVVYLLIRLQYIARPAGRGIVLINFCAFQTEGQKGMGLKMNKKAPNCFVGDALMTP